MKSSWRLTVKTALFKVQANNNHRNKNVFHTKLIGQTNDKATKWEYNDPRTAIQAGFFKNLYIVNISTVYITRLTHETFYDSYMRTKSILEKMLRSISVLDILGIVNLTPFEVIWEVWMKNRKIL